MVESTLNKLNFREKSGAHMHYQQKGFGRLDLSLSIVVVAVIIMVVLPACISLRNRYLLRASATDVLLLVKKAQAEAVKRDAVVAMAINSAARTCTAFIDDQGADQFPQSFRHLIFAEPRKTVWKSSIKARSVDIFQNDKTYALPHDITIHGASFPGIVFDRRGIPLNIPQPPDNGAPPAYGLACSTPAATSGKSFVAIDIKSKKLSSIQYQVLINAATGRARLVASMNGGTCFQ